MKSTVLFINNALKPITRKTAVIWAQTTDVYNVSVPLLQSSSLDSLNSFPAIAYVEICKFVKICKTEDLRVYLMQWRHLLGPIAELSARIIVRAITEGDGGVDGEVAEPILFFA